VYYIHGTESSFTSRSLVEMQRKSFRRAGVRGHRLAGMYLNLGYIFVYAPRDVEEIGIMGNVLQTGIAFMSGGQEVA
jgi:hypothetical protein